MDQEIKKTSQKRRSCKSCPQCKLKTDTSCFWQIEKNVPEKFKPSEIGAYICIENISGIGYLRAVEIDRSFDSEFLSWFVSFCVGQGINAFWKTKDVPFCLGSQDFVGTMLKASSLGMV